MRIEQLSDEIKKKLPIGTDIVFNKDLVDPPTSSNGKVTWALKDHQGKIIGTERPGNREMYWVCSPLRRAFLAHIRDFDVQGHVVRGADIRARACL